MERKLYSKKEAEEMFPVEDVRRDTEETSLNESGMLRGDITEDEGTDVEEEDDNEDEDEDEGIPDAQQATANVKFEKITKENLKEIYNDENFKSEVDKVFPNDTSVIYKCSGVSELLNDAGIDKKFNEVFLAYKHKLFYRSIKIVCAAYFTTSKIIIASRLHEKHMDSEELSSKNIQQELKNNMIETLNKYIDVDNEINKIEISNIEEDKLNKIFKNKLNEILAPKKLNEKKNADDSTVYKQFVISDKSINQDIDKYIIKFSVNFNIIYNKNTDSIYYSINTDFDKNSIQKYTGVADVEVNEATGAPAAAAVTLTKDADEQRMQEEQRIQDDKEEQEEQRIQEDKRMQEEQRMQEDKRMQEEQRMQDDKEEQKIQEEQRIQNDKEEQEEQEEQRIQEDKRMQDDKEEQEEQRIQEDKRMQDDKEEQEEQRIQDEQGIQEEGEDEEEEEDDNEYEDVDVEEDYSDDEEEIAPEIAPEEASKQAERAKAETKAADKQAADLENRADKAVEKAKEAVTEAIRAEAKGAGAEKVVAEAKNAVAEAKKAVTEAKKAKKITEAKTRLAEIKAEKVENNKTTNLKIAINEAGKAKNAVAEANKAVNNAETKVKAAEKVVNKTRKNLIQFFKNIKMESSINLIQNTGTMGGKKRKLTRKELNTMSLNKLKHLHKVNKIKMNKNRTIKALINNYIKNYK